MHDTDSNRIAHLGMIEEIIKRLASNSFLAKGWSLTLAAALVALAITNKSVWVVSLAILPVLVFWALDAYWLLLEKVFRALYDQIRTAAPGSLEGEMFSMKTEPATVPSLLQTIFSPSIGILHGSIIIIVIGAVLLTLTFTG